MTEVTGNPVFAPSPGLRSAFMQSLLASKRPARWLWKRRGLDLDALSRFVSLDVMDELGLRVTLTGWHTPHAAPRSLVVMIHGWEGSHESNYLYGLACTLHMAGHSVFRLNLRDHGSTHHGLNEAMFHSARLAEVLGAISKIQALDAPGLPLQVIGFSLGGNFALRVGMRGPAYGLHPRLCVGISPAINPGSTLRAIDDGPAFINRYFLDKWRKTMDAKDRAHPGRYDFAEAKRLKNFTEITRHFVAGHTDYADLETYLAEYTLRPSQLMASATPLAIVTAEDDSVCPPADFAGLTESGSMRHFVSVPRGGHCGFIQNWRMESWADALVADWLAEDQRRLTTPAAT